MSEKNICEKILFSQERIAERVSSIGKQISEEYKDKEVIFVSILNGSFMFTSDLMKCITIDCLVDFMQISTYGNDTSTSDNFLLKKDLSLDIKGKDIIVVEDIIDSGYTLSQLKEYLEAKNPSSLKIATLIDKPARRKNEVKADYVGFVMDEDYFIVGYGLDFAQKYRNLPYIGVLEEHIYS
ncbi:MAG: hypoxanthine phosphoribosyltransferase [Clostridia bacterium]|nr:hypoxanthine phosphoribosyltransferase [Clostridia bacterium]